MDLQSALGVVVVVLPLFWCHLEFFGHLSVLSKWQYWYSTVSYEIVFTVVPCILILSKSFIYQLMHNRVALKEY